MINNLLSEGIPQSSAPPSLVPVWGENLWEVEDREADAIKAESYRQTTDRIDGIALDPDSYFKGLDLGPGDAEKTKRLVINAAFLEHASGAPVPDGETDLTRALIRQQVAHERFEGRGADSEEAFHAEIVREATGRKSTRENLSALFKNGAKSALIESAGEAANPEFGFAKWKESAAATPGYDPTSEPEYYEAFTKAKSAAKDACREFAPELQAVWSAFTETKKITAASAAVNPITLLTGKFRETSEIEVPAKSVADEAWKAYDAMPDAEDRKRFMASLHLLAETLPKEEQATFWGNLSKQSGRDLSGLARGLGDFVGSNTAPFAGASRSMRDPFTPDSPEQIRQYEEQSKGDEEFRRQADFLADVMAIQQSTYDPMKYLAPDGSWTQAFEKGAYAAPGAIASSAMAAIPGIGMPAFFATAKEGAYQSYRQQFEAAGMSYEEARYKADILSTPGAALEMLAERFAIKAFAGKLPFFEKAMASATARINSLPARFAARTIAGSVEEGMLEQGQGLIYPVLQKLAGGLGMDVPDQQWLNGKNGILDGFWKDSASMIVTMLPLSIFGGARGAISDSARVSAFREASDKQLLALGMTPEAVSNFRMADRVGVGAATVALEQGVATIDPQSEVAKKAVEELKVEVEKEAAAAEAARIAGIVPSFTRADAGWTVHDTETGQELATSPDLQGAWKIAGNHSDLVKQSNAQETAFYASLLMATELTTPKGSKTIASPFSEMTTTKKSQASPEDARRVMAQTKGREAVEGGDPGMVDLIFGESETKFNQRARETTNRIYLGGTVLTVFHEEAHGYLDEAWATGRMTYDETLESIRFFEKSREGKTDRKGREFRLLPADFDSMTPYEQRVKVQEAVSELMEIEIIRTRGKHRGIPRSLVSQNLSAAAKMVDGKAAKKFASFLNVFRDYFGFVLSRVWHMKQAIKEGKIKEADLQAFTAKLFGLDTQDQHEAAVVEEIAAIVEEPTPAKPETPRKTAANRKKPRKIDTPARREAFRLLNSQNTELTSINKIISEGGKLQSPPTGMLKIIMGLAGARNLTEKQMAMRRRWVDYSAFQPKSAFGNGFNGKVAQEIHGMLFGQAKNAATLDDWAGILGGVTNDEAMIAIMGELDRVARGLSKENDPRNSNREFTDAEISAEISKPATPKQTENFNESNSFDFGRNEIRVDDLKEGDVITIDGEEFTVEAVEDGGTVVLRDGARFGRQVLESGEILYIEDVSTEIDPDLLEIEAEWLVDKSAAQGYTSIDEHADADPAGFEQIASEAEAFGQGDSQAGSPASGEEASGEAQGFSLETQTGEDIDRENAAAKTKAEIQKRGDARLTGSAGDLSADMFGEGETPLFNERRDTLGEGDPFSLGPARMADALIANARRRMKDPRAKMKIFENIVARLGKLNALINATGNAYNFDAFGKPFEGRFSDEKSSILNGLAILDAILAAVPPDLRGRVGGYTQLAKLDTDEKRLDYLKRRMKTVERVVNEWLGREYTKELDKLLERAKPKRKPGEKPKGKAGADVHALFDVLRPAKNWNQNEVDKRVAGLEASILSGNLTPEEEAHATLELNLVGLVGNWREADVPRKAAALANATSVFEAGYATFKLAKLLEKEDRAIRRENLKADTGKQGTAAERDKRTLADNGLKAGWRDSFLSLISFEQLSEYLFGRNSKEALRLVDMEREASAAKEDGTQEKMDALDDMFTQLGKGSQLEGEKIRYDLAQKSLTIQGRTLSPLEAITATLMWRQEDGRRHMEGHKDENAQFVGPWHYDQSFVDDIEAALSDDAKAVRSHLSAAYGAEWAVLNPIYKALNGINLPSNPNYSPLTVKPQQASAGQMVDPVTGSTMSGASATPGSLRTRGSSIAEPEFRDALQTYIAHTKQMQHWMAYAPFMTEAGAILRNRELGNSIEEKGGKEALGVLRSWLDYFQAGGARDAAAHLGLNQTMNRISGRAASSILIGRMGVLAIQATQLAAALAEMPVGSFALRFGKLMTGQLGWGAAFRSEYIQRRLTQMPVVVQQAMDGLKASRPNRLKHHVQKLGRLISGADALMTAGTFAIVHDYQLKQAKGMGLSGSEAEAYAMNAAERSVDRIAQPTRPGARSLYENTATHPAMRVLWSFASESRQKIALGLWRVAAKDRSLGEKARALAVTWVVGGMVASIIRAAMRDIRSDDDDEIFDERNWSPKRLLLSSLTAPLQGIPFLGDAAEGGIYSVAGEYLPEGNLLSSLPRSLKAATQVPEWDDKKPDEIMRDVETILSGAAFFNDNLSAASSLSHLASDVFGITQNVTKDE